MGNGKAEQRGGGHQHTDGGDGPGAQPPGQPVGEQAGDNGAAGNNHGHNAGKRNRHPQLGVHDRPSGADERVRQAKANKGQVNHNQQKRVHMRIHPKPSIYWL